jgi:hypothetical protein
MPLQWSATVTAANTLQELHSADSTAANATAAFCPCRYGAVVFGCEVVGVTAVLPYCLVLLLANVSAQNYFAAATLFLQVWCGRVRL